MPNGFKLRDLDFFCKRLVRCQKPVIIGNDQNEIYSGEVLGRRRQAMALPTLAFNTIGQN